MSESKQKLMIVEDDPGLQRQLKWSFEDFEVIIAENKKEALAGLRRHEAPVVTLDLGLPPDADGVSEGLATLEQLLELNPNLKVIVVTGNDDRNNAVKAISLGAYDFYQKPIDPEILNLIVKRAHHVHKLESENKELLKNYNDPPLNGIIGNSPQMLKVCRTIEKVAPTDATSLLLGESGTGKEILARALHDLSTRIKKRFTAINCAAIPENLLESELFGYEKGAFTGASKQTIGKIECANGGTLFLDEVGDLPMSLQAKLLRFLQERVIERLGGRTEIPVDVRVICATHQNIEQQIKDGLFREDLFYRISEITIRIPPLRERNGDAVLIARSLLNHFVDTQKLNKNIRSFSHDGIQAIESHSWPGNIRELQNRIKRAVIMAETNQLTAEDLELSEEQQEALPLNLRQVRDHAEQSAVLRAINLSDGNISKAAELLGVSRPTLYDLMNKHDIRP
ncbi:Two-component system response regulator protein [hydrothermal vent metagenome]|uniref:Two-component system response regulator protein n=1 Tax=hydrothermal vent metagenome TaxID=652676 RepID=A0A3B0Z925_9ZZZZ